MPGGRRLLALLATVLAVGVLPGTATASAQGDPGTLSVLVLGDSYSAGNGAGSYLGAPTCHRSAANYGRQFERLVEVSGGPSTTVATIACSGAVTSDILKPRGGRPAQVTQVDGNEDVVLLTIGGNDVGFGTIVATCLLPLTRSARGCEASLAKAERMVTDGTVATRLTNVLTAIRARTGPATRIVLVGYPYLEGDAAFALAPVAAGARVRGLTDAGDRVGQQVTAALGPNTIFVSTKQAFAGHELLAARSNPSRWLVAPFTDAPLGQLDLWYHPNTAGHAAIAKVLFDDPRVPKADVR